MRGLVTYYTLFVTELHSRRVHPLDSTSHPDEAFIIQTMRHLTDDVDGALRGNCLLICDHDRKSAAVERFLAPAGVRVIRTPILNELKEIAVQLQHVRRDRHVCEVRVDGVQDLSITGDLLFGSVRWLRCDWGRDRVCAPAERPHPQSGWKTPCFTALGDRRGRMRDRDAVIGRRVLIIGAQARDSETHSRDHQNSVSRTVISSLESSLDSCFLRVCRQDRTCSYPAFDRNLFTDCSRRTYGAVTRHASSRRAAARKGIVSHSQAARRRF